MIARAYLVISRASGAPNITELRKGRPSLRPGEVAIRIAIDIPPALFEQFIPEVKVELSEPDLVLPTVEVEPEAE